MTTSAMGKGIEYDHTLRSDKHFFGGYLNLAYDNYNTVLKNYEARFGKPYDVNNLRKISGPDYQIRIDFLKQHLPVLGLLDLPVTHQHFENLADKIAARRDYLFNSFKTLADTIVSLRHFYTHYYHPPLPIPTSTYALVNHLFLSVATGVRATKKKNDHTRQFLKKRLTEEYDILYKEKKALLSEKKKINKRINIDLSPEGIHNAIFNDAFAHMIGKNKENGEYFIKKLYQAEYDTKNNQPENGIALSKNSLLFLLSMFLTRRESEELRDKTKYFKARVITSEENPPSAQNNSFRFMATHWVYSYLAFKGAKNQLHNIFSRETLLMQIVDELSKVPDELYQCLPEERRQELIEDINEYYKTGTETESMEASQVIHPVIRKRYENKFNYFVLRYLDEFVAFPSLRFQVHVGYYTHDSREKTIGGTQYITERKVKEAINVFGRLSRIAELKEDYFTNHSNHSQTEGWELFPAPSYNISNQNIPIYIHFDKNNSYPELLSHIRILQQGQPAERTNLDKSTKEEILKQILPDKEKEIQYGKPIALLSLNELPSLLYELLIHKKSPEEIENTLREKIADNYTRIKQFQPGDIAEKIAVSKKLRKSTSEDALDTGKLLRIFQKEIQVSKEKLNIIDTNRQEKRQGKRPFIFYSKEIGREANWLADDLKMFMPLEARSNWKGYQHSQLQYSLASYNQNPYEAISLLENCWDFNDRKYIRSIDIKIVLTKHSYFDTMYEAYLVHRQKVFQTLIKGLTDYQSNKRLLSKFLDQQHIWQLFNKRQFIIRNTEHQKKELLTQPFVFARGIFDAKPTFIPGKQITETPALFADWYQHGYKPHSFQQFYAWERDYTHLFQKALDSQEAFLDNRKNLNLQEQESLIQLKTDLHIKSVKTQDLFLKLIADDIYQEVFGNPFQAHLSDIYLTLAERQAIQKTARAQHQRETGDNSSNIINDSFIWSKVISFTWPQVSPFNVKIKDLRKRRQFLESEKVKTLLAYESTRTWTLSELDDVLLIGPDSYETIRREELLKEIQKLELHILSSYPGTTIPHPTELEQAGNPNFRQYIATGLLQKQRLVSDIEVQWLKDLKEKEIMHISTATLTSKSVTTQKAFLVLLLRNKFAHNQLPSKDMFDMICNFMKYENDPGRVLKACRIMVNFMVDTVNEFIQYCKKEK